MSKESKSREGWYPDDQDPSKEQFWDGEKWTNARRQAQSRQVPVGWYLDDKDPTMEQYWDGSRWTDARRPRATGASAATPARAEEDRGSTALVVVGYLTAFFLPIIGFILGIVLLVRRETGHGLAVFLISIAVGVAACSIAFNDAEDELDSYSDCLSRANTVREVNQCD